MEIKLNSLLQLSEVSTHGFQWSHWKISYTHKVTVSAEGTLAHDDQTSHKSYKKPLAQV